MKTHFQTSARRKVPGKLLLLQDWLIIFFQWSFSLNVNVATDEVEKSHAFIIIGQLHLHRLLQEDYFFFTHLKQLICRGWIN